MVAISPKYVIDKKGNKKAILLDIKEYSRLLKRLEELEDALDLDRAVKAGREFRDYQEIRAELHREGRWTGEAGQYLGVGTAAGG